MDDAQLLRYSRHILLDELGPDAQQKFASAARARRRHGRPGHARGAIPRGRRRGHDHDLRRRPCRPHQPAAADSLRHRRHRRTQGRRCRAAARRRSIPMCGSSASRSASGPTRLVPLVAAADIVLDGSDNFATRHAVNRACVAARQAPGFRRRDTLRRPDRRVRHARRAFTLLSLPLRRRRGDRGDALRDDGRIRAAHRHRRRNTGRRSAEADRGGGRIARGPAAPHRRAGDALARDARPARSRMSGMRWAASVSADWAVQERRDSSPPPGRRGGLVFPGRKRGRRQPAPCDSGVRRVCAGGLVVHLIVHVRGAAGRRGDVAARGMEGDPASNQRAAESVEGRRRNEGVGLLCAGHSPAVRHARALPADGARGVTAHCSRRVPARSWKARSSTARRSSHCSWCCQTARSWLRSTRWRSRRTDAGALPAASSRLRRCSQRRAWRRVPRRRAPRPPPLHAAATGPIPRPLSRASRHR